MSRISHQSVLFSKVSANGETVIPREVRKRLKLKRGDGLRYRITADGVLLDKVPEVGDGAFVVFSEWWSKADQKAYGEL